MYVCMLLLNVLKVLTRILFLYIQKRRRIKKFINIVKSFAKLCFQIDDRFVFSSFVESLYFIWYGHGNRDWGIVPN